MAVAQGRRASKLSRFYRFRSSTSFLLVTIWVSIFNDVFLFGTIVPVLPYALPHRIDIPYEDVQFWIAILLAMYGGALLAGSLLFGWVGDRLKQRHTLFLTGLVVLLVATCLLQFGRHAALLIIGRFLQGLSAAVVWTSGLALLTDIFGRERYGEAVGYAQTATSVGTTCAPLLGGLAYGRSGYGAVSAMSIGTVGISVVLAALMVEPKAKVRWLDQLQREAPDNKDEDIRTPQGTDRTQERNGSANSQPSGAADERSPLMRTKSKSDKTSHRPAYPTLFRSGRVLAGMGGIFTFAFTIINLEGMIPLFVKDTFHWNATQAALIFLCWIIPGFLGPIAGKASDRFGPRWMAIGGFLFAVPPLICMRFVTKDTMSQKVLLCALLTLLGFGLVWTVPACISDLTLAATEITHQKSGRPDETGASTQAFGLFVFAYSCGSFLGPTVAGVIKAKTDWGTATTILACVCALACIPILFKTSPKPRKNTSSTP